MPQQQVEPHLRTPSKQRNKKQRNKIEAAHGQGTGCPVREDQSRRIVGGRQELTGESRNAIGCAAAVLQQPALTPHYCTRVRYCTVRVSTVCGSTVPYSYRTLQHVRAARIVHNLENLLTRG